MLKKTALGIMLVLYLLGSLNFSISIPARAEPRTWTVDDDGPADFNKIQEAINAANSGDSIYVYNGTYYENVVVNKSVSLLGESMIATIIDAMNVGTAVNITADDTVLQRFTIQNGIKSFNLLDGGIYIFKAKNVTVVENLVLNSSCGILVGEANSAHILSNTVVLNLLGIGLEGSDNCTLRNNNMTYNWMNLGVIPGVFKGIPYKGVIHDIDTSNLVEGKPVYYWINQHNKTIPLDAGFVGIINSSNITVENLNLSNNLPCILFAHTEHSLIENVNFSGNGVGITLYNSAKNTIRHNALSLAWADGIWLTEHTYHNTIVGNTITSENKTGAGILLWSGVGANYVANNILSNLGNGFILEEADGNTFCNNVIEGNQLSVYMYCAGNNKFYHNNFVNNSAQVNTDTGESVNVWDDGYPLGGNYWSDYNGTDQRSGSYQNETGSDGIGDTPYMINENNFDNYPLMGPYSSFNTGVGYSMDVVSNSTVEDFEFFESNSTIRIVVSNMTANQTFGFCRLTIPHTLIAPPYNITVNNNPVNYTPIFQNENISIIYFSYQHSTLEIIITPEFPQALILPLFTLPMLIVVFTKRNIQSKKLKPIFHKLSRCSVNDD